MNKTQTWIDADTFSFEGTISFYSAIEHPRHILGNLPDQDANKDGLPDDGQEPVFYMPLNGICHRINLIPPCEPAPMPSPPQQ
jgi:hypothetical protein